MIGFIVLQIFLREYDNFYGVNQIIFPLLENIYEPKYTEIAGHLRDIFVNNSAKFRCFLKKISKVIRQSTVVTAFPAQLKVCTNPKTLRFWALFYGLSFIFLFIVKRLSIWLILIHIKLIFQALKWHQNEMFALLVSRAKTFSLVRSKCDHTVYSLYSVQLCHMSLYYIHIKFLLNNP